MTIVIGGGIVGLSAAYFLARRGVSVTLLEKDSFHGGASTGNAGLIAVGHGPLPKPGLTADALRWIFDRSRLLYIPPSLDPALNLSRLAWFRQFRRACGRDTIRRSMDILATHGHAAGECFHMLIEAESIECEYHTGGQLDVFRTEAGLARGVAEAEVVREYGYAAEVLDGDALRQREPAFRTDVVGAVDFTDRAYASPQKFILELADRVERHGVDVRTGVEVEDLIVDGGACHGVVTTTGERLEAERVVLAAGIWSTSLARRAGLNVPMQPGKGYHVNVAGPAKGLGTACVLAESYVAVTPMDGGVRLAGTLEFSGINERIVPKRVEMLVVGARRYLDSIEVQDDLDPWCGLRPCTADGLPVIGWSERVGGLFIATGHAMMGFALGPLAGRVVSECLLGDTPSVDLGGLSPSRFD